LQHLALKPEPINFLKVLLCNTFKKFIVVRLSAIKKPSPVGDGFFVPKNYQLDLTTPGNKPW
jgi:hypothetical protein